MITTLLIDFRGGFANLLVGFKIFSFRNNYNRLNSLLVLNESMIHLMNLLKVVFSIVIVSHFIGLLWYLLARYEVSHGVVDNWLEDFNVLHEPWYMQYIVAFYW